MLRVSHRGRLVAYCHSVEEVARHIDLAMLEEVRVAPGPEVNTNTEVNTDRSRVGPAPGAPSTLIHQVR
jgi:hypothetical protein